MGRRIATIAPGRVRLRPITRETTMPSVSERPEAPTAIQTHLAASFVSLELSRSIWLITSLSPASGEKMSKHSVRAGDVAALLARFFGAQADRRRSGPENPFLLIVVIQEAGSRRLLASSGAAKRRRRKPCRRSVVDRDVAPTAARQDRQDRRRGPASRVTERISAAEPRVCAMVKAPTPEEEDRRRLCRELSRKVLIAERGQARQSH